LSPPKGSGGASNGLNDCVGWITFLVGFAALPFLTVGGGAEAVHCGCAGVWATGMGAGGVEADGAEEGPGAVADAVVGNSTFHAGEDLVSGSGAKIAGSFSGAGFEDLPVGGLALDLATGCDFGMGTGADVSTGAGAGAGVTAGAGSGVAAGAGAGSGVAATAADVDGVGCCALSSSIFWRMASRARAIFSESALGGRGVSAWATLTGVVEGVTVGVAATAVAATGAVTLAV
jgi:hypothetical protein